MAGARMRPSRRLPVVIAVTICSIDQSPRPVSLSGVRLRPTNTPKPGMAKPTSEPPSTRFMSGCPRKYPGVWQSPQQPSVTRYLPRSIGVSAAAKDDEPRNATIPNTPEKMRRILRPPIEAMRLPDLDSSGRDRAIWPNFDERRPRLSHAPEERRFAIGIGLAALTSRSFLNAAPSFAPVDSWPSTL